MLYDKRWDAKIDSEIIQALRKAKEVIADGSRWCCGTYAKTKSGFQVHPHHQAAVSFCSIGALALVMESTPEVAEHSFAGNFLIEAASEMGAAHATKLNDNGGHPAALRMFDRAIELARAAR